MLINMEPASFSVINSMKNYGMCRIPIFGEREFVQCLGFIVFLSYNLYPDKNRKSFQ